MNQHNLENWTVERLIELAQQGPFDSRPNVPDLTDLEDWVYSGGRQQDPTYQPISNACIARRHSMGIAQDVRAAKQLLDTAKYEQLINTQRNGQH